MFPVGGPFTFFDVRFDLILNTRPEYLILAVGDAKSHPVTVGGRHEDAISFLTELGEELEAAQVTLLTFLFRTGERRSRTGRLGR